MRTSDALLLSEARRALRDGSAREIRERAKLTQREVAESVGVSADAVTRWEQGSRSPRGTAALRYARLLAQLREVQGATA